MKRFLRCLEKWKKQKRKTEGKKQKGKNNRCVKSVRKGQPDVRQIKNNEENIVVDREFHIYSNRPVPLLLYHIGGLSQGTQHFWLSYAAGNYG